MKAADQFTVDYLLLRGWILTDQREGFYRFYTKGLYTVRTRRNYFPLEVELFKNGKLVMASAIITVGMWKTKTKKFNFNERNV